MASWRFFKVRCHGPRDLMGTNLYIFCLAGIKNRFAIMKVHLIHHVFLEVPAKKMMVGETSATCDQKVFFLSLTLSARILSKWERDWLYCQVLWSPNGWRWCRKAMEKFLASCLWQKDLVPSSQIHGIYCNSLRAFDSWGPPVKLESSNGSENIISPN